MLKIERDQDPRNPREDDNLGRMHCEHRRYTLGDRGIPTPFVNDDWRAGVLRDDVRLSLPIYMYDHSGITLSHSPFSCPWDSGKLGWHYLTKADVKKNFNRDVTDEELTAHLKAELEEYDAYIQGEVWGFVDGNDDSCWGFIGEDLEDTGILDHFPADRHDEVRKAWEARSYE